MRVKSVCVCVCVCVCVLVLCIHVCLHVFCMSLQNLGEESLLILALGHNLSLPLSIHGSPSILCECRGSCGDEMRTDVYRPWWRQHCHQTRHPLLSFNECAVIVFVCALECISCAHASLCVKVCVCVCLWDFLLPSEPTKSLLI